MGDLHTVNAVVINPHIHMQTKHRTVAHMAVVVVLPGGASWQYECYIFDAVPLAECFPLEVMDKAMMAARDMVNYCLAQKGMVIG